MQIPFVDGADFVALDDTVTAPQAIVNEEFVKRYIGDAGRGRPPDRNGRAAVRRGRRRENSLANAFGEPPTPVIYLSLRDRPNTSTEIHLRTREGQETEIAPALRRAVPEIDASLPIFNVRTMVASRRSESRLPQDSGAHVRRARAAAARLSPPSGSTRSWRTRSRSGGLRSACGSPSARPRGGSWCSSSLETLGVIALGASAGWLVALLIDRETVRAGAMDTASLRRPGCCCSSSPSRPAGCPPGAPAAIDPLKALDRSEGRTRARRRTGTDHEEHEVREGNEA